MYKERLDSQGVPVSQREREHELQSNKTNIAEAAKVPVPPRCQSQHGPTEWIAPPLGLESSL